MRAGGGQSVEDWPQAKQPVARHPIGQANDRQMPPQFSVRLRFVITRGQSNHRDLFFALATLAQIGHYLGVVGNLKRQPFAAGEGKSVQPKAPSPRPGPPFTPELLRESRSPV